MKSRLKIMRKRLIPDRTITINVSNEIIEEPSFIDDNGCPALCPTLEDQSDYIRGLSHSYSNKNNWLTGNKQQWGYNKSYDNTRFKGNGISGGVYNKYNWKKFPSLYIKDKFIVHLTLLKGIQPNLSEKDQYIQEEEG